MINDCRRGFLVRFFLVICFGLVGDIGNIYADSAYPDAVWKELGKVRVPKFVAEGESRSEVVAKLNQALHHAEPDTKIEIRFVPPNVPEIDEAKYARSMHIKDYDCTVVDLLRVVATYDVDWKVKGNEVVGRQGRMD